MFTIGAPEAVNTETSVFSDAVQTGAAIEAGLRCTVVGVDGALPALITHRTVAGIGAVGVAAGGTIFAGRRRHVAFIDVLVTEAAGEAQVTFAGKVDKVGCGHAPGIMPALVRGAGIHAHLTVLSGVGKFTYTLVGVDQVDASATIQAGTTLTVINVCLTIAA